MKIVIDIPEEEYNTGQLVHYFGCYSDKLDLVIYNGTPLKEWLSSFNTDSAPICFNKIQDLKRECEKDERTTKS